MPILFLSAATKYRQRLEIFEKDSGNLVEEVELGAHVTSHRWKTTPGSTYIIEVSIRDQNDEVVASGHADCKAGKRRDGRSRRNALNDGCTKLGIADEVGRICLSTSVH